MQRFWQSLAIAIYRPECDLTNLMKSSKAVTGWLSRYTLDIIHSLRATDIGCFSFICWSLQSFLAGIASCSALRSSQHSVSGRTGMSKSFLVSAGHNRLTAGEYLVDDSLIWKTIQLALFCRGSAFLRPRTA